MNKIKLKPALHEIISLERQVILVKNSVLSQNHIAVTPNCQNWLFLRPNTATGAGVNPSYLDAIRLSSFDGVTPQNKPIGEYVGRFLYVPRVNPITLYGDFLKTQNHIGVFIMKTYAIFKIKTLSSKLASFSPIQSLAIGAVIGLPIACLVVAVLVIVGT